jgi:hypothetical protein
MRTEALNINFVKVGAVAAFLLVASVVIAFASLGALSEANPRAETQEFLDDISDNKNYVTALVWLTAFSALLIVPFSLGLYYGLRRWGEDHMRVAVLFAVVAAIFLALAAANNAAFPAYILPAWAAASDEATRDIVLSDARTLAWVGDAIFSIFGITIAIATIVPSLVMLRLQGPFWLGVGWLGIIAGVLGILGAFFLASEVFEIIDFISIIPAMLWILGSGIGLWRLPEEEPA